MRWWLRRSWVLFCFAWVGCGGVRNFERGQDARTLALGAGASTFFRFPRAAEPDPWVGPHLAGSFWLSPHATLDVDVAYEWRLEDPTDSGIAPAIGAAYWFGWDPHWIILHFGGGVLPSDDLGFVLRGGVGYGLLASDMEVRVLWAPLLALNETRADVDRLTVTGPRILPLAFTATLYYDVL